MVLPHLMRPQPLPLLRRPATRAFAKHDLLGALLGDHERSGRGAGRGAVLLNCASDRAVRNRGEAEGPEPVAPKKVQAAGSILREPSGRALGSEGGLQHPACA